MIYLRIKDFHSRYRERKSMERLTEIIGNQEQ